MAVRARSILRTRGLTYLETVVVVGDGRVSKKTAEADGATHGGKDEGTSATPGITSVVGLVCRGSDLVQTFLEEVVHVGRYSAVQPMVMVFGIQNRDSQNLGEVLKGGVRGF